MSNKSTDNSTKKWIILYGVHVTQYKFVEKLSDWNETKHYHQYISGVQLISELNVLSDNKSSIRLIRIVTHNAEKSGTKNLSIIMNQMSKNNSSNWIKNCIRWPKIRWKIFMVSFQLIQASDQNLVQQEKVSNSV